jgi:hypothetical protein
MRMADRRMLILLGVKANKHIDGYGKHIDGYG